MEPSLRSSAQRGNECKLRRPDPAAHETTKRFVESLCPDIRISQYADLNFAAKKMERDVWYWLEPVAGGRVGFLVFRPGQPAIWIDEQLRQSYVIQMRVSTAVYQKTSVFIASLNKTDGLLRIEDAWIYAGESYLETPFTQRWERVLDFFGMSYKEESQLQQGLRIEPAIFLALSSLKTLYSADSVPALLFAQGEAAVRRLRVQMTNEPGAGLAPAPHTKGQGGQGGQGGKGSHPPKPAPQANGQRTNGQRTNDQRASQMPMFINDEPTDDSIARIVAHEEYPDTYNLWINGVKKGYAAVQDLELSRELRIAAKDVKELFVKVGWNDEFNMYEILSRV